MLHTKGQAQEIINIMDIIEETGLSKVLKARIKDRPDLGKDERYGRRVIFELNKAYPIVMSPMLDADEYEKLRNRMSQFQKETNVKSAIHITLICGNGYKKGKYSGIVQNVILGDDLFEK